MLDAQTIKALQGFPAASLPAFGVELPSVSKPANDTSAQHFIDSLTAMAARSVADGRKMQRDLEESAERVGKAVSSLAYEDREQARDILERSFKNNAENHKSFFLAIRGVIKVVAKAKAKATKNLPQHIDTITMLYDEIQKNYEAVADTYSDGVAVFRASAALLNEESRTGKSFDNADELAKYLRSI